MRVVVFRERHPISVVPTIERDQLQRVEERDAKGVKNRFCCFFVVVAKPPALK